MYSRSKWSTFSPWELLYLSYRASRCSIVMVVTGGFVLMFGSKVAGESLRTVIISDGPLPGVPAGAIIEGFQFPRVSADGRAAFEAGLLLGVGGTDVNNRTAIWAESAPGMLQLVARQGDPIPGLNYRFDDLSPGNHLQMTASGHVYFDAGMSHLSVPTLLNNGLYQFTPENGLRVYATAGPVGNDDVNVLGVGPRAGARTFTVNDAGGLAAQIVSVDPTLDVTVSIQPNGAVDVLAANAEFPTVSPSGAVAYRVGERIAGRELRVWNPQTRAHRTVARENGPAPNVNGATFRLLAEGPGAMVNGDNGLTFIGELRRGGSVTVANDYGIWQESSPGGPVNLLLREGDRAPGTEPGVVWSGFSNFAIPAIFGRQGGMALKLELAGPGVQDTNNLAIWSGPNAEELHLVAREGMPAPGTEDGTYFNTFTSFGVTQDGRGVILGHLAGNNLPAGRDRGIWGETPSGELKLLVRAGDTLTLPNGEQTTFLGMDFDSTYGISEQGHVAFHSALASFQSGLFMASDLVLTDILGDFSRDGRLDIADLDLLIHGISANDTQPSFDLNDDNVLSLDDRDAWLALAGERNLPLGRTYSIADANLDGTVNASDFDRWFEHRFSTESAWSTGDFNADGFVDGGDFGLWNDHRSVAADNAAIVPEPSAMVLVCVWLLLRAPTARYRKAM